MQSAAPTPTQPESDAEEALHYRALLRRLADMGTDLAADVHAESKTRQPPAASPKHALTVADYALAYERVARGVRRAILLACKLAEPVPVRRAPAEQRQAARTQIIRAVEDKIHRSADEDESDTLQSEFYERLDGPDLAHDLLHRPTADIILEICRDLGLEAIPGANDPWMRRKPRDLAILRARATGPHSAPPVSLADQRQQRAQAATHPRAPPRVSA